MKGQAFPPALPALRRATLADYTGQKPSDNYGYDSLDNRLEKQFCGRSQGFFLPLLHYRPPYGRFTGGSSLQGLPMHAPYYP
jgi:hypothetical protein